MVDDAISNLGKISRYRVRGIVTLQTATKLMLEYGDMKASVFGKELFFRICFGFSNIAPPDLKKRL